MGTHTDTTDSTTSTTGAVTTTGGVGGNAAITGTADITGDTTITGTLSAATVTETSDGRLKKEVVTLPNAIGVVQQLRGVSYSWDNSVPGRSVPDGVGLRSGLIAQEVERILPGSVKTDREGWKSVAYTTIIPYLVEAVKEQQRQIEELRAELADQRTAGLRRRRASSV